MSLNSSSSKYEGLNHFMVNKTNDADSSKPSSPEMHNISQESFSLSELKKKNAQGIINPGDKTKHKLIKNRVPRGSFPLKAHKDKQ